MTTTCTQGCERMRQFEKVLGILDRFERDPARLIPILQAVQEEYRYLPERVLTFVATSLRLPPAQVFGVATFYTHFALQPKGKYVLRLCDGTACHVRGSMDIYDALKKRLGLVGDATTTDDMLFTLETVSCLGACGLAPVFVVNDDVHGQSTPDSAVQLIEEIFKKERGE
jgi:NADH-quinone oxidoreductase subunit E